MSVWMSRSDKPFVIAIEGPSGVGKSTILPLVQKRLEAQGLGCCIARNLDAGPFGTAIQSLAQDQVYSHSLALTLAAARAYICESAGANIILCDRFVLSTLVFQVFAGVDEDYLLAVNEPFAKCATHIVLTLSADALQTRRAGRNRPQTDWFKRSLACEREVDLYTAAFDLMTKRGHILHRVDAAGAPDETAALAASAALEALNDRIN